MPSIIYHIIIIIIIDTLQNNLKIYIFKRMTTPFKDDHSVIDTLEPPCVSKLKIVFEDEESYCLKLTHVVVLYHECSSHGQIFGTHSLYTSLYPHAVAILYIFTY